MDKEQIKSQIRHLYLPGHIKMDEICKRWNIDKTTCNYLLDELIWDMKKQKNLYIIPEQEEKISKMRVYREQLNKFIKLLKKDDLDREGKKKDIPRLEDELERIDTYLFATSL